jgi:hypothetical protein
MVAILKKQPSKVDNIGNMIKKSIIRNTKKNKSNMPHAMNPYS